MTHFGKLQLEASREDPTGKQTLIGFNFCGVPLGRRLNADTARAGSSSAWGDEYLTTCFAHDQHLRIAGTRATTKGCRLEMNDISPATKYSTILLAHATESRLKGRARVDTNGTIAQPIHLPRSWTRSFFKVLAHIEVGTKVAIRITINGVSRSFRQAGLAQLSAASREPHRRTYMNRTFCRTMGAAGVAAKPGKSALTRKSVIEEVMHRVEVI
ncbi:hypothetical protein [Rhodococcus opacus]|uniref:hypothetical protein n=1 Tax=Rhodococcus opacus TaxID=37919 RepID=UPI00155AD6C5|nr:hypothetical protein [Rhodococcus opacus]